MNFIEHLSFYAWKPNCFTFMAKLHENSRALRRQTWNKLCPWRRFTRFASLVHPFSLVVTNSCVHHIHFFLLTMLSCRNIMNQSTMLSPCISSSGLFSEGFPLVLNAKLNAIFDHVRGQHWQAWILTLGRKWGCMGRGVDATLFWVFPGRLNVST